MKLLHTASNFSFWLVLRIVLSSRDDERLDRSSLNLASDERASVTRLNVGKTASFTKAQGRVNTNASGKGYVAASTQGCSDICMFCPNNHGNVFMRRTATPISDKMKKTWFMSGVKKAQAILTTIQEKVSSLRSSKATPSQTELWEIRKFWERICEFPEGWDVEDHCKSLHDCWERDDLNEDAKAAATVETVDELTKKVVANWGLASSALEGAGHVNKVKKASEGVIGEKGIGAGASWALGHLSTVAQWLNAEYGGCTEKTLDFCGADPGSTGGPPPFTISLNLYMWFLTREKPALEEAVRKAHELIHEREEQLLIDTERKKRERLASEEEKLSKLTGNSRKMKQFDIDEMKKNRHVRGDHRGTYQERKKLLDDDNQHDDNISTALALEACKEGLNHLGWSDQIGHDEQHGNDRSWDFDQQCLATWCFQFLCGMKPDEMKAHRTNGTAEIKYTTSWGYEHCCTWDANQHKTITMTRTQHVRCPKKWTDS